MTDVSPIKMISFAVEHITKHFWSNGRANVVGTRENFSPFPLSTGPVGILDRKKDTYRR